jgi:hypothetical protein
MVESTNKTVDAAVSFLLNHCMKILRVAPHPSSGTEIIGRFSGHMMLILVCVSLGILSLCYFIIKKFGITNDILKPLVYSIMPLMFAFSRLKILIKPRKSIASQMTLFGIPIFWHTIPAERIISYDIVRETDGLFTLRFINAAHDNELVIEGFSSESLANFIATSFRESPERNLQSIESYVIHQNTLSRDPSLILSIALVVVSFAFTPLELFKPTEPVNYYYHAAKGCLLIQGALLLIHPKQKIISANEGIIKGYIKQGMFRVAEYRQKLGKEYEMSIIRIRFDRFTLLYPIFMLLQIGVIVAMAQSHEEENKRQRIMQANYAQERIEREKQILTPETRAGIKYMKEYLDKKRANEAHQDP